MLEHLPPEPGALGGIHVDVVRLGEAEVGDVGLGEDARDVGGVHDRVRSVGRGEGLVVAECAEAERGRERGQRQRRRDLGVDRVGQPARPREAGPPAAAAPAGAGAGVHGRNPRCGGAGPRIRAAIGSLVGGRGR